MRNITYFSVIFILVFIIHNAESRTIATDNAELNPYFRRSSGIDNFDITKFVNTLFMDAKKKNRQMKNRKRKLEMKTQKKKINKDGEDSNYDSLGLDDHVKNQIVRSNKPKLGLKDIEKLFHSSNTANYKKIEHILRSGGGLSINNGKETKDKALKAVDGATNEKRSELVFDLEEYDDDL